MRHTKPEVEPPPWDLILAYLREMEGIVQNLMQEKAGQPLDVTMNEVVITKGQVNKAEKTIEKWLEQLQGDVIAELDFIDKTTFGYLDSIPKGTGMRIIISNLKDAEKCVNKAKTCSRDRPHLEIMRIEKVHQRWIGSKESFFIEIGTDLKSDALGHSTHTIRRQRPEMFKETQSHFEQMWTKSEQELRQMYGKDFSKSLIYRASA